MAHKRTGAAIFSLILGLSLTACSETGGAPRSEDSSDLSGGVNTPRYVVSMITHGAPGDTFWDLVRKGAQDAAQKDNIELRYSSDPEIPNQVNFVQSAIDSNVDGIALTLPNATAVGPTAAAAVHAGIPTVAFNAGMDAYQDYDLQGFFGQEESVAGEQAGQRLAEQGAKHVLCVIHEQGNSSQEARCDGLSKGATGAKVEILYVNGRDLSAVQATLQSKLSQDSSIDWVMGLVAPVALTTIDAAKDAGADVSIATFDTNAELVNAIEAGDVQFAVDQQPYLQGYMAVDSLWLALRNGTTVGGGRPVYTGPSFVDASNVDTIAEAAREGLR
ncbi:MAG: substrate-binding domain-containing protein [Corynebacterium sp.]|nr:substrate-binding domain-containing protein [Corynebacterium sp.]